MSEFNILYIATGSLLGLVLASFMYSFGGRKIKGVRRFGASFIIAATINVSSLLLGVYSFWLLAVYPFKILEFLQGYSNDRGLPGWVKRLLISLTSLMCGALLCWVFGCWWLLVLQFIVGTATIFFSFKNPVFAAAEETLVCLLNSIILIYMPFFCLIN